MSLINHLAAHRRAAGLTQAQLAEAIGVSRKTINTVENRVFIPSTLLALKLARHLDVSLHDLFELAPETATPEKDIT
ncbi:MULTISPECIES: helix-turn-helix transcriptional regulator [unclassified Sulfitobacter]|uniref:helix-turn-helix transcriptional regulator n=1 Tax=unclassified Sulfitobacter TaxID=196795 RepID=UPI0023E29838|nr:MULTISPECIES: helix-turn-helix transcriptional regulator [unclassified Sulfitobacter]